MQHFNSGIFILPAWIFHFGNEISISIVALHFLWFPFRVEVYLKIINCYVFGNNNQLRGGIHWKRSCIIFRDECPCWFTEYYAFFFILFPIQIFQPVRWVSKHNKHMKLISPSFNAYFIDEWITRCLFTTGNAENKTQNPNSSWTGWDMFLSYILPARA